MQILKADFIDVEPVLESVFDFDETDPINIHFEACGYEASDFINNTSSSFFLMLIALIFVLLMFILSKVNCCQRIKNYAKNEIDATFFNGISLFMSAELLVFATSANLNIYQVSKGEIEANLSLYFAWTTKVVFLLFFIGLISYLWKNSQRLQEENARKRIGACYDKFDVVKSPKASIMVMTSGWIRNFGLSYAITFGRGNLLGQIMFISLSSHFILALIGHSRPYKTRGVLWL